MSFIKLIDQFAALTAQLADACDKEIKRRRPRLHLIAAAAKCHLHCTNVLKYIVFDYVPRPVYKDPQITLSALLCRVGRVGAVLKLKMSRLHPADLEDIIGVSRDFTVPAKADLHFDVACPFLS